MPPPVMTSRTRQTNHADSPRPQTSMPELPEVEHLRLTLTPRLVGRNLGRVRVMRRDVIRALPPRRGAGRAPLVNLHDDLLEGCRIRQLRRCGKQLAIIAEGDAPVLLVQLGMTGQLLFLPAGQRPHRTDHIHIRWSVVSDPPGDQLIFRDPRRFGGVTPYDSLADLESGNWANLGSDALTIRHRDLHASLSKTRRAVKAALLDQQLIAGVGNIYADESLFRAGIHPLRLACTLDSRETQDLARAIRSTLRRAIKSGGTTLRDYVDGNGQSGRNRGDLLAYSRQGQPCRICGSLLQHLVVAQRTTTFCPSCQSPHPSTVYPHARGNRPLQPRGVARSTTGVPTGTRRLGP